jgi:hypothetical protein
MKFIVCFITLFQHSIRSMKEQFDVFQILRVKLVMLHVPSFLKPPAKSVIAYFNILSNKCLIKILSCVFFVLKTTGFFVNCPKSFVL